MKMKNIFLKINREVKDIIQKIDDEKVFLLKDKIKEHDRIFLLGEGRTGLVGKMFGIRLIQIGKEVYFVGDSLSPSFLHKDLLIAMSGRGESEKILYSVKKAYNIGGEIFIITGNSSSHLLEFSKNSLIIPHSVKSIEKKGSYQPLNSLFEQSLFFTFESLIIMLKDDLKITEEEMTSLHFNL